MFKILIVDDEPDVLTLVMLVLGKAGIEVISARDASECLMKLKYEEPDLILLDIIMPGMNGYELCKKIKDNPKTKNIRIVHYSVLDREIDKALSMESGADGFILKPLSTGGISKFSQEVRAFLI